jgi:4-phospho-D-threonate 3-dehydrogenase / 4-phospho-D-erythronate 3-dehydrogenase
LKKKQMPGNMLSPLISIIRYHQKGRIVNEYKPIVGITMGDPVGVGPEILLLSLQNESVYKWCRPVVIGDSNVLKRVSKALNGKAVFNPITVPEDGNFLYGTIDLISRTNLDTKDSQWGLPNRITGLAMIEYIKTAVDLAMERNIDAFVTGPINKVAMKMAGSPFSGHTELLAQRTNTDKYVMMMAGNRLRIVLVTIHQSMKDAIASLSVEKIFNTIEITHLSLESRFGIQFPRIAVAGLNPHAGEQGLFGSEEQEIIIPAIRQARSQGWNISGPFPPDTVFYQAINGQFDTVVCMYHDQGLIPFKLIHFMDGVNTTLGLPVIRTSVDHGTAYDIAGAGIAEPGSMIEAIRMAASHANNVMKGGSR